MPDDTTQTKRDDRPEESRRVRLSRTFDEGSGHTREVVRSGALGPTVFRRYEQELTYTTSEHLKPLQTCFGHRALSEAAGNGVPGCIAGLADGRYGGRVSKRYLIEAEVSHLR